MKGDFTRDTFDAEKHFQRVLMQQGRVQLDADWNELAAITERRDETAAYDIIGTSGGPADNAAFRIFTDATRLTDNDRARLSLRFSSVTSEQQPLDLSGKTPSFALKNGGDFFLSSGRYYVDGIQCENEFAIPFTAQPDRVDISPLTPNNYYLMYLDVWQRHLTALDDPHLLDVALNGVDTATRLKTVWQVRALPIGVVPPDTCSDTIERYNDIIAPSRITLRAWTDMPADAENPCLISAYSGYKGLENQLYRVEIHDLDSHGKALRWKWSRENGAVVTAVTELKAAGGSVSLTVATLGPDGPLGFHDNDIVELLDDACELEARPGKLARIDGNPDNRTIKLKKFDTDPLPVGITYPAKLRRWEGCTKISGGKKPLEHGIYVMFEDNGAACRSGDYWQIPARAATATAEAGEIEWPRSLDAQGKPDRNKPLPQSPQGIIHHYCRLGIVALGENNTLKEYSDCRCLWPALTAPRLEYVSGDGQEVMPDLSTHALMALPAPVVVAVRNLHCCDDGAALQFSVTPASDRLSVQMASQVIESTNSGIVNIPGAKGIVACTWRLDPQVQPPERHSVTAALVDPSGAVLAVPHPIVFNASLSIASQVAYDPGRCDALKGQNTVQKAVDQLAGMVSSNDPAPVHVIAARYGKDAGLVLKNGQIVAPSDLQSGLYLFCDREIDSTTVEDPIGPNGHVISRGEPTCVMTVEVPYPLTSWEKDMWDINELAGYHPFIVHGRVAVDNKLEKFKARSDMPKDSCAVIIWKTEKAPITFLERILQKMEEKQKEKLLYPDKILIRLTLKGNFIWSRDAEQWLEKGAPGGFLDGDTFRVKAPQAGVSGLIMPSGDKRRGGDFEMWFWIAAPAMKIQRKNMSAED